MAAPGSHFDWRGFLDNGELHGLDDPLIRTPPDDTTAGGGEQEFGTTGRGFALGEQVLSGRPRFTILGANRLRSDTQAGAAGAAAIYFALDSRRQINRKDQAGLAALK